MTVSRRSVRSSGSNSLAGYVSQQDLFQAYRKAKADVFHERVSNCISSFVDYERDLSSNLARLELLLTRTLPGKRPWERSRRFVGGYALLPKSLSEDRSLDGGRSSFVSVTGSQDDVDVTGCEMFFRPVIRATVDMHVVSALWINKVGHFLDRQMRDVAYGGRLRRYRDGISPEGHPVDRYHLEAVGSFRPYFDMYRSWRDSGIRTAKEGLRSGERVVLATLDFQRFYQSVKIDVLSSDAFLEGLGVKLNEPERFLHDGLIQCCRTWAEQLPEKLKPGGLPIGLAASHVLANAYLRSFDDRVLSDLAPMYYGRYVDDIILVFRDAEGSQPRVRSIDSFFDLLSRRFGEEFITVSDGKVKISVDGHGVPIELVVQQAKVKVFSLAGIPGIDLLSSVESDIKRLSSEWRLLPDVDQLDRGPSADVMTAADGGMDGVGIRHAEGVSIRRMAFAGMVRAASQLSELLDPGEWTVERSKFYDFLMHHALGSRGLVLYYPYLFKVVGLAISSGDWAAATRVIGRCCETLDALEHQVSLADDVAEASPFDLFRAYLADWLRDARLAAGVSGGRRGGGTTPSGAEGETYRASLLRLGGAEWEPNDAGYPDDEQAMEAFFLGDWALRPFRRMFDSSSSRDLSGVGARLDRKFGVSLRVIRTGEVAVALKDYESFYREVFGTRLPFRHLLGLCLPTRPVLTGDITALVPRAFHDSSVWARYARALRGIWVSPSDVADPSMAPGRTAKNGDVVRILKRPRGRREAIGQGSRWAVVSYLTLDSSWSRAAEGRPDLSKRRLRRLTATMNDVLRMSPRPEYVVFPELSVPRRWLSALRAVAAREGISLIAGVDYARTGAAVRNQVAVSLVDWRLGFAASSLWFQGKEVAAPHERDLLRAQFGVAIVPDGSAVKLVYEHGDLSFGVLICSELTNIAHRATFRGKVDILVVPAWNMDITSFSALVDSAALDVHAYVVLVNNRRFGDTRVRGPAKLDWKRDLVRVRGGGNDYAVVATIPVRDLREFQSWHESPSGPFKPVPEGFEAVMSAGRRIVPGTGSARPGGPTDDEED